MAQKLPRSPRWLRRRRPTEAALAMPPLALLAACGAGGGDAGPAVGTPAVAARAETTAIPAGSTETSGNLLANASSTGGSPVIAAVSAPATAASTTPGASAAPVAAPAVTPTAAAAATIDGNLGRLVVQPNGSYTYAVDPANAAFTALRAGETTTETFTYTPSVNGRAGTPQTLTITVTGTNDAPTLVADNGGMARGGAAVVGNVLANDSDPDRGTTLSVVGVRAGTGATATDGQRASAVLPTVTGTYGTLTMEEDGSYSYMALAADADTRALGAGKTATETFTYTVSDGWMTRTATLSFTVSGSNDAPVLVADSGGGTPGQSVTGNVLTNDSDVDGDALSVAGFSATGGAAGTLGTPFATAHGALTLAANGAYSFAIDPARPAVIALKAGQTATESFTYTASDGTVTESSTLTITITGANDAPVLTADTAAATAGATVTGNLLTNDNDPDADALSVTALAGPGGLTATIGNALSTPLGAITVNANGSYSFVVDAAKPAVKALAAGATATEAFTYTASDGTTTRTSTLTVTVTGTNDAPTAVADAVAGTPVPHPASVTLDGNLLANDGDIDGNAMTLVSVSPAGGDPVLFNKEYFSGIGAIVAQADGSFIYVISNTTDAVAALKPGETLTDKFTYVVTDGTTNSSSTLTVTINGVNDAPTAVSDWYAPHAAGTTLTGNVLTNDSDRDPGTTLTVVSASRTNGAPIALGTPYSFTGSNGSGDAAILTINSDGSFTAVANPVHARGLGAGAQSELEYHYTVSDGAATSTAVLRFYITGVDDLHILNADTASVTDGSTVTGNVVTNDIEYDIGQTLRVGKIKGTGAEQSVATNSSSTTVSGSYGSLSIKNDGSYIYTPGAGADPLKGGQVANDVFTYSIRGESSTLSIAVTGIDDPTRSSTLGMLPVVQGDGPGSARTLYNNSTKSGAVSDPDDGLFLKQINGQAVTDATPTATVTGTYGSLTVGTGSTSTATYTLNNSDPDLLALLPGQIVHEYFSYRVGIAPGGSGSPDVANAISQQITAAGTAAHRTAQIHDITVGAEVPNLVVDVDFFDRQVQIFDIRGTLINGKMSDGDDIANLHLATGAITGVLDGQSDIDTLRIIDNAGATITPLQLDLGARLDNFEKIELAGSGNTTLTVRPQDVLDATGSPDILRILGDAGDRIDLDTSWVQGADQTVDGQLYHSYASGGATLLLDPDLLVI